VVGQEVLRQLGGEAGLGQTIAIAGRPFTVVGVLAPKGSVFGRNQDDVVFIPLSLAPPLAGTRFLSVIYMSARSGEEAGLAAAHALAVLRHRHPQASGDDPVRILSQDQLLSMMRSTNQLVTLFLGAVAGISLLVGGIGIMNIMLVSVTERTREVGIRMAVGARPGDILGQFLTESVLLSFTGGLVGVALGLGSARWIARLIGSVPLVVPSAVVAALGLAVAVGLFFGVYPAWKASRLDPIVALRHE
jgi:putative ABC transport system permease protein